MNGIPIYEVVLFKNGHPRYDDISAGRLSLPRIQLVPNFGKFFTNELS